MSPRRAFYTRKQAARYCGVCIRSVIRWEGVHLTRLHDPRAKSGRGVMYEGGELERWARRRVRDREAQSIREMQPLDDDSDASQPTPKPAPANPRKASDPRKAKAPEDAKQDDAPRHDGPASAKFHSMVVDHQRANRGLSYQQSYSRLYSDPDNFELREQIKAEHLAATLRTLTIGEAQNLEPAKPFPANARGN